MKSNQLNLICLSFVCVSAQDMQFENIFSDFHGGFGLILHDRYPVVYEDLFASKLQEDGFRPYVLCPDPMIKGGLGVGEKFSIRLYLFGSQTQHALDCANAIGILGLFGLTRRKFRFHVENILVLTPDTKTEQLDQKCLLWSKTTGWIRDALKPFDLGNLKPTFDSVSNQDPINLLISLETPLRIKRDGAILRKHVDALTLFNRLLGRVQIMSSLPGQSAFFSREEKTAFLGLIDKVKTERVEQRWVSMTRVTNKNSVAADYGGLLGSMVISNVDPVLIRLLDIGVWLGIGNKTSFGLGRIRYQTV